MRWVLFAFTAPAAVVSWVLGLLSMVLWLAHKPRFEQTLVLTLEWREWFAKGTDDEGLWGYSTTLVRTIWWQPGARDIVDELDEPLERHETVHLRQWEDDMLRAFLVGLGVAIARWAVGDVAGGFLYWLIIWLSGAFWLAPNFLTALMRFGPKGLYRDSEHERSAYAQTLEFRLGESWWVLRERYRDQQDGI